ncbi:MAG: DUF4976 domain-containing protein [Marmoricola sp.]
MRTVTRQRAEALYVLDHQIGKTFSALSRRPSRLHNHHLHFRQRLLPWRTSQASRQDHLARAITSSAPSISGPGISSGDRYDPATTVDLAPTIAAYAGASLPVYDGISLRPVIEGGDLGWQRPVVTESMIPESRYSKTHHALGRQPLNTEGIRLGRWKLTRYSVGAEKELYDLQTDPLELNSLHKDPRYAQVLAELIKLQKSYANCAGATCHTALPKRFQQTAAEVKAITDAQIEATAKYYQNPPAR